MAVDTEEMTATTETEPQTEDAKRERVDPATLPADEKVSLNIQIPAGLKVALNKAGLEANLSGAAWARSVLAERLEYIIPESFTEGGRVSRYKNEDERKAAQAAEAKANRAVMKAALKALKEGRISAADLGIS